MFAREVTPVLGPGAALAIIGSIAQTFTAAGTTQATAAAITTTKTYITTATEGQGAILPGSMTASDEGVICNSTSVDVYVYPPVGYKINGGTTNLPLMIPPTSAMRFSCVDGNNYMVSS